MIRTVLTAILIAGLAAGCSSSVAFQAPTIPTPLVEKIPMSIGLRMPANFQHFVHQEKVFGREEWSIDLGRSNAALFEDLFRHMFAGVRVLSADDDPQLLPLDALVETSIDEFEFATPDQSNTEAFAVWIRYRLKVYDREGKLLSEWPVSAYGKSQTTTMGKSQALQRAAVLAMRDAAALMVMKFDQETQISTLLNKPATQIAPVTEAPSESPDEGGIQTTALEEITDESS
jgi:hypothetical protein